MFEDTSTLRRRRHRREQAGDGRTGFSDSLLAVSGPGARQKASCWLTAWLLLLTVNSLLAAPPADDVAPPTDSEEAGHGFVEFRLSYYDNADSGDGNPFLDEALTVIEPVVIFDYSLSDRLAMYGKFSYDNVSSASIDRLSNFPQQSGASGDYYFGLDLGLRYQLDATRRVGGFVSGSTEYDYNSFGLGGYFEHDIANRNATVKYALNGFFDTVDVIRFDGSEDEGSEDRTSVTGAVNWYQILGPRTHGEVGATLTYQQGFLETAYNAVVIEDPALPPNPNLDNNARGLEITEELPDDRIRTAVHGKVRHLFDTGTSVELGGRLYSDSWGISSVTLEPRLYQWLIDEKLYVRLRYRFYVQTEADDYSDSFTVIEPERTQDSDLADFTAHTLGLKFVWNLTETVSLDIGGDVITRSDGLDQLLGSIGLRIEF